MDSVQVVEYTMSNKLLTLGLSETEPIKYEMFLNVVLITELERGFKAKKVNKPTKAGTSMRFIPIKDIDEFDRLCKDMAENIKRCNDILSTKSS